MGWVESWQQRRAKESTILDQARRHVCNHRAAQVAVTQTQRRISVQQQDSKFSQETDDLYRQDCEFRKCVLEEELALRSVVAEMNADERVMVLFEIMDIGKTGFVNCNELSQCLLKIDGSKSHTEALNAAKLSVSAFDSSHDGRLSYTEFKLFLSKLSEQVGCATDDLARFLIFRILATDNGPTVVAETIIHGDLTRSGPHKDKFVQVRIIVLFEALDYDKTGVVEFDAVVRSMCLVAHDMDKKYRDILFLVPESDKENDKRTLSLSQFAAFLCNVVAASPAHVDVHKVTNSMTMFLCNSGGQCSCSRANYDFVFDQHGMYDTTEQTTKIPVSALDQGRLTRLFDLWDLNHNGYIEFSEFFLGLRKFHETKDLDTTFLETATAMSRFDINEKDGKLDRIEFSAALAKFADEAAGVDLSGLIDYMVVHSALRDNEKAERDYIMSLKTHGDIQDNLGSLRLRKIVGE